jgi:hypothetical protein
MIFVTGGAGFGSGVTRVEHSLAFTETSARKEST